MKVLVFNAGSSSLKFGLFDTARGDAELARGAFDSFGSEGCTQSLRIAADAGGGSTRKGPAPHGDIGAAIAALPGLLDEAGLPAPDAVGHRIAHGGEAFLRATLLDDAVLKRIEALTPLAPLHNPANLAAVATARAAWPEVPQLGVFDTAFHLSCPPRATTYAVPRAWRAAGLRRYGFHGTSHKYVAQRAAEALGRPLRQLRVVSVHLGNGASACAIDRGESIDSSMGMTPLEGLVMGTRSGDIDPGAFGYLQRELGLSLEQIEQALYSESGLKGLCGLSDMRAVEARAAEGDPDAQLAIEVYAYRARKFIGAYAAAMGGLDAVVFTGGIGENSASMRRRICDGLQFLGVRIDDARNAAVDLADRAAPQIGTPGSGVAVIVTETAEQLMIAREVAAALRRPEPAARAIPVAVSGRHVHLSQAHVTALFGPGARLAPERPLRQPGNFLARPRVTVEGPRGRLERVAILGPARGRTQIEVSRTDSFVLGLDVPVRDSGDLEGTPVVRLIGPAGSVETDGLIVAARHIHANPEDAAAMGLNDGDHVDVHVGLSDAAPDRAGRGLTFSRVLVRVQPGAFTEMHVDTDEANAAGLRTDAEGAIAARHRATPLPG